jgi:hypothetical protein
MIYGHHTYSRSLCAGYFPEFLIYSFLPPPPPRIYCKSVNYTEYDLNSCILSPIFRFIRGNKYFTTPQYFRLLSLLNSGMMVLYIKATQIVPNRLYPWRASF